MLLEKALKYYGKEYDLNCAETILYAANEEYNINLTKETFKIMAAFGGGMGVESVCGVITSSLAVISILYTKDRGHESKRVKNLSKDFFEKFTEKLKTDNCAQLKSKYRNDEIRCSLMVETAAKILDEIVKKEKTVR
ncbi:MAG: C-GCAxxG-C-C family (seleno)protein [Clostridiaceae bacterium]